MSSRKACNNSSRCAGGSFAHESIVLATCAALAAPAGTLPPNFESFIPLLGFFLLLLFVCCCCCCFSFSDGLLLLQLQDLFSFSINCASVCSILAPSTWTA